MVERLARQDAILALSARAGWPAEHPAAADLDLLAAEPPGVVTLAPAPDVRVWIVLGGCPPDVRLAARRLSAAALPPGVTRIRLH